MIDCRIKKLKFKVTYLAMAIVNHTNEVNGISVEQRQKTNDECFDFGIKKIREFLGLKEKT
jgi:hypothetical protein